MVRTTYFINPQINRIDSIYIYSRSVVAFNQYIILLDDRNKTRKFNVKCLIYLVSGRHHSISTVRELFTPLLCSELWKFPRKVRTLGACLLINQQPHIRGTVFGRCYDGNMKIIGSRRLVANTILANVQNV